jgi:glutamate racemase
LLLDRLRKLASWPVNFIDPAPAIAHRVASLLGPPDENLPAGTTTAIFTSGRPRQSVLERMGIKSDEGRPTAVTG